MIEMRIATGRCFTATQCVSNQPQKLNLKFAVTRDSLATEKPFEFI
jgi:hypothetical protein